MYRYTYLKYFNGKGAQYNVYVSIAFCRLRCKDKHLSPNDKVMIYTL